MRISWNITGSVILLLLWAGNAHSQVTEARILPSSDTILIGDQPDLTLEMDVPDGSKVYWPEFTADTVMTGLEILERNSVDTIPGKNGYITLRQKLIITSFDSGQYVIPPVPFEFSPPGDTTTYRMQSEPAYLMVASPDVDMEADIKPIKPPLEAPLTLAEILPWILVLLGIAAIIAVVVYIIRKRKRSEPVIQIRRKPSVPAHVQALDELEKLRQMKLWQSGRMKEYYTALTDIIRWYIEERFGIPAPEMTTEEIMSRVGKTEANKEVAKRLHDTLLMADLVKFAKEQPIPVENDISMNNCIDFVKETRPQPEPLKEKNEEIKAEA